MERSLRRPMARRCLLTTLTVTVPLLVLTAAVCAAGSLTIDADRQFDYARSRLEAGAYDEAVSEFNRFIHFFPSDARVPEARLQTGTAHFEAGRHPAAVEVFRSLAGDPDGDAVGREAFFMLSRSHARMGLIEQAMLDLHNLMTLSTQVDVLDRARYELGWLHVERGQWNQADESFRRITAERGQRLQIDRLTAALAESDRIATKNPTAAGLLSIVPGGGQLYCGRYQDALVALLLNGGLIWAAWEAFDEELYALGGVIAFVEVGFYSGNIYGAVSSAHKYNRDRIDAFRESLRRFRPPPLAVRPVPGGAMLGLSLDF